MFGSSKARELGKAIEQRDLAAIRRLAAEGADLNEIGRDKRSPLSFALDRNALDAADVLLELGADPTKGEGEGGRAPLTEMVSTDARSELLKKALEKGASPEFTDKWGVPMVHWAVTSRCGKNLEHQLASPLSCALDRREWATARFLVEHGAPMHEAPGYNGLDAKFRNTEPPAEGSAGRAEYDALVKAMTERGFAPPARPGARG
jgi:ankyrin repeat protein